MKASITRIITGIFIIAIGAGFLLDNLNVIEFNQLASNWWPLIVILLGIHIFVSDTKNYLWALLVSGFGVVWLLRELDIVDINPWQFFWPLVIIVVGASIILRRGPHSNASKAERDDLTAILGATDQKNTSGDFKGSKITSIMGGAKLDLRKATIKKEATVELFCLWGGVELVIPRNVVVRNQSSAILGGTEDKSEHEGDAKSAPILYVTGDVIMGGVEIKN